jgi:transcriptional regulator
MTYRPPHVREDDPAILLPLIARAPLATLITVAKGEPLVTYVPMLAREDEWGARWLEGHIARANDQWKQGDGPAVALFRAAEHYISPSWYATKQRDPRVVPTYDYVAIEARGPVRFIHDHTWLRAFVSRLTDDQESRIGSDWETGDAPADYMENQLRAIVGVQLRVESLMGLFKLNRNHPEENIEGVIAGLNRLGTPSATLLEDFMG